MESLYSILIALVATTDPLFHIYESICHKLDDTVNIINARISNFKEQLDFSENYTGGNRLVQTIGNAIGIQIPIAVPLDDVDQEKIRIMINNALIEIMIRNPSFLLFANNLGQYGNKNNFSNNLFLQFSILARIAETNPNRISKQLDSMIAEYRKNSTCPYVCLIEIGQVPPLHTNLYRAATIAWSKEHSEFNVRLVSMSSENESPFYNWGNSNPDGFTSRLVLSVSVRDWKSSSANTILFDSSILADVKPASQLLYMCSLAMIHNVPTEQITAKYGVDNIDKMSDEQIADCVKFLKSE